MVNNLFENSNYNNIRFGLENFKAFRELQKIDVKPLTVICGVNNCGKSSLIQCFLLLSQTITQWQRLVSIPIYEKKTFIPKEKKRYKTNLLFEGALCHLSHFNNVINYYSEDKTVTFKFEFDEDFQISITFFNPFTEKMIKAFVKGFVIKGKGYDFQLDAVLDNNQNIDYYTCIINHLDFEIFMKYFPFFANLIDLGELENSFKDILINSNIENHRIEKVHVTFNGFIPERIVIPSFSFPEEIKRLFNGFKTKYEDFKKFEDKIWKEFEQLARKEIEKKELKEIENNYEKCLIFFEFNEIKLILNFLNKFHYIGPLRVEPSRYYQFSDIREMNIGNKGENAPQILTLYSTSKIPEFKIFKVENNELKFELYNARKTEKGFQEKSEENYLTLIDGLSKWAELLGFPKIETERVEEILTKVLVQLGHNDKFITLQDVGFGISQIFPVYLESLRMELGETLILEQPEIHLHPSMQSKLADFLLCMAVSGKNFIIETHSEHLVDRLCLRIAQDPDDKIKDLVSMVFIENTPAFPNDTFRGSLITKLKIDEYGDIENWPVGFFDKTDHRKILKAGIEKRKRKMELKEEKND